MPTIKIINGTRIYINTGHEHNPPHVHVNNGELYCIINLLTLECKGSCVRNMKEVLDWVSENREFLMEEWKKWTGI